MPPRFRGRIGVRREREAGGIGMPYLWIFVVCYAVAFAIFNIVLARQSSRIKARLREFGASDSQFTANVRAQLPAYKEAFIRIWAPLMFCAIPAALLCLAYFIFA